MSLPQFFLLTCALAHAVLPVVISTSNAAYPPPYGLDQSYTAATTAASESAIDLVPVRREVYGGGRIIDISHRYHSEMPSWESADGLGDFLWLAKGMKNGSLANNSEMKLPAHTGTHVDAPGHVYDHYYDAGFDVDTLDLDVLNGGTLAESVRVHTDNLTKLFLSPSILCCLVTGIARKPPKFASRGEEMRALLAVMIWAVVQSIPILSLALSLSNCAYPSGYGDGSGEYVGVADAGLRPVRREVYENGEIYDITHKFTPHTPVGDSTEGIGQFLTLLMSMKNGSDYNFSEMKIPVHSGTHVDAPGHMYENYYEEGFDVDSLDLRVLNGPALLVDVPRDRNITAEVMESLNIPKGVKRVLFRTLNTDRRLMYKKEFDTSYVGFMKDGAQWLVDNTDIKLVGIDYLSVAAFDDLIPSHLVFLKSMEIILVEGLKLDNVQPGIYSVHCLPLRLVGSEGSPIRCILIK